MLAMLWQWSSPDWACISIRAPSFQGTWKWTSSWKVLFIISIISGKTDVGSSKQDHSFVLSPSCRSKEPKSKTDSPGYPVDRECTRELDSNNWSKSSALFFGGLSFWWLFMWCVFVVWVMFYLLIFRDTNIDLILMRCWHLFGVFSCCYSRKK